MNKDSSNHIESVTEYAFDGAKLPFEVFNSYRHIAKTVFDADKPLEYTWFMKESYNTSGELADKARQRAIEAYGDEEEFEKQVDKASEILDNKVYQEIGNLLNGQAES